MARPRKATAEPVKRPLRSRIWDELRRTVLLLLGVVIAAAGYSLFQIPYDLAAGGLTGLGIIVNHFTGFSPAYFYLIANIPLLFVGYVGLGGWRFLIRTILAVVAFAAATEYAGQALPELLATWPLTDNMLLSAIYAGLVGGVGGGLIYAAGGTLGGTAIIGRLIQVRTGIPLSQIYLFVDGAIVLTAAFVFGWETALYAYLTLLLSGLATDYVLEGPSRTRTATIITTRPEPMTRAIIAQMGRGVSYWEVKGGFTHEERTIVLCTFYRPQLSELKRIISEVERCAFVTIGDTQQAIGQGFLDLRNLE